MKKALFISTLIGVAGFLAWHFANQVSLLKKTCFAFNGYKINSIKKDDINIEIYIKLRNRSDIAIALNGYNLDVFINNTKVSTLASNLKQVIDRDSFAPLTLMVDIDPTKLLNASFLSGFLLNYNNAIVKIQGTVSVNAGGISKDNIPVLMESKLRDMLPSTDDTSGPCA